MNPESHTTHAEHHHHDHHDHGHEHMHGTDCNCIDVHIDDVCIRGLCNHADHGHSHEHIVYDQAHEHTRRHDETALSIDHKPRHTLSEKPHVSSTERYYENERVHRQNFDTTSLAEEPTKSEVSHSDQTLVVSEQSEREQTDRAKVYRIHELENQINKEAERSREVAESAPQPELEQPRKKDSVLSASEVLVRPEAYSPTVDKPYRPAETPFRKASKPDVQPVVIAAASEEPLTNMQRVEVLPERERFLVVPASESALDSPLPAQTEILEDIDSMQPEVNDADEPVLSNQPMLQEASDFSPVETDDPIVELVAPDDSVTYMVEETMPIAMDNMAEYKDKTTPLLTLTEWAPEESVSETARSDDSVIVKENEDETFQWLVGDSIAQPGLSSEPSELHDEGIVDIPKAELIDAKVRTPEMDNAKRYLSAQQIELRMTPDEGRTPREDHWRAWEERYLDNLISAHSNKQAYGANCTLISRLKSGAHYIIKLTMGLFNPERIAA